MEAGPLWGGPLQIRLRARSSELTLSLSEPGHLDILEERSAGRQPVDVQKRRVEDPITSRGRITIGSIFVSAVVLAAVEQVDQRPAVVEPVAAPVFDEAREIVNSSGQILVSAALIGDSGYLQATLRVSHQESRANPSLASCGASDLALYGVEWIAEALGVVPFPRKNRDRVGDQ